MSRLMLFGTIFRRFARKFSPGSVASRPMLLGAAVSPKLFGKAVSPCL